MDGPLKLHLDLINAVGLLFLLGHEVEVIDVLTVEGLDPFGDDEALLQKLDFLVLADVGVGLVTHVQINFQLGG